MNRNFYSIHQDNGKEFIYIQGYGFSEPPLHPSPRNLIRIYANAIGYGLILFLLLQSVIPLLVLHILRLANPAIRIYRNSILASKEAVEVLNILSSVLCYILPLLLLLAVLRLPLRTAFPMRHAPAGEAAASVCVVLASSAIGSSVSMLLSGFLALLGLHPSGPQIPVPDSPLLIVLVILSSAVAPAIFEELLFRGVILQSLRRFGDLFALMASTLLFALLHRNLVQLPNAVITGFVLAFLAIRTHSLWIPMLCHFVNNLIPVLLQSLTAAVDDEAGSIIFLGVNGIYLILGITGIILLLYKHPVLLRPMAGEGRSNERFKFGSFLSSVPVMAVIIFLTSSIVWNMLT